MVSKTRIDAAQLSEIAVDSAREVGIVGGQVALLESGEIIQAVTGVANLKVGTPVTEETIFSIGSTTKVFNAALILSLVDDGKLELDTPVHRYIHGYKPGTPGTADGITLRRLLSMTAGLDNGTYSDQGANADAIERYVREQANVPLVSVPGTRFGYSNAGTVIAGHAAERATGMTWDDLLRERILGPASLTRAESLIERVVHHPFAVGHEQAQSGPVVVDELGLNRGMGPAGVISATAADLVQFAKVLLQGGAGVVTSAAVKTMQKQEASFPDTIVAQAWGVGPFIKRWNGVTLHGHSGTTKSGSSYLVWIPSHQIALATVVNTPRRGYPFADLVMKRVLGEAFGIQPPPPPSVVEVDLTELERCSGIYVAFGVELHVEVADDRRSLRVMQVANIVSTDEGLPPVRLVPVGQNRFLAEDRNFTGGRGWGVAFIGDGEKPTHFLNGVFLARRLAAN